LKAAGYDVVEVSTTAAALLDRVAVLAPDVIIIDSDSPTRDTLEQLSFVNAKQPAPDRLVHRGPRQRDDPGGASGRGIGVRRRRHAARSLQPILEVAVARFEQDRSLREELDVHAVEARRAQADRSARKAS
jgi:response regulator NasT